MMRTQGRRARRRRRCDTCRRSIEPGDRYLEHVASPNHDGLGNPSWWRVDECETCAVTYGRGDRLPALAGSVADA